MNEQRRRDGRLPLTIIGGFLGAGKSTWLRHQLHEERFGTVHLIVNEAAETPVDNLLLGKAEQVEVLAGGCACCEGREALIAALRNICGNQDALDSRRIDRILLETSGLADPGAIALALSEDPILARRLAVDGVIVLVDALHGAQQLAGEELSRRQVEAAERIVITKSRGIPPGQVARLTRTLRLINPAVAVEGAELGVPLELPADLDAQPYELPEIAARAEPIKPYRLSIAEGGGWASLSVWLSALLAARGNDIVRVKGVVTSPDGRLLLQSVRRVVQAPEILPEPEGADRGPAPQDDIIVLIGRGMDEKLLARSWERFVLG
ncbi:CobW family GTP-binding protein [Mesorhizobium sp. KR2-14]|uniref:CobW family GTP-binding protein n=1 Tax=Mesorhizobium sp. KR2-14 TaxID=3156610 RepID=UPI0032B3F8F3